jgi:UV DNA damage endonuclease
MFNLLFKGLVNGVNSCFYKLGFSWKDMKIGYPCINRSIGCTANTTFRLANYSEERLKESVGNNLRCLKKILEWNFSKGFMFFRISSDLVPFASHEVCKFDWGKHFRKEFKEIGDFMKEKGMRISMHPDQFVLINALDERIVERSVRELDYHCKVLDLMGLDSGAKVQIHVGGVYGDKEKATKRFVERYKKLPVRIKKRLAVENDDRLYSLKDCLEIHSKTGVPIIFDNFHHECLNEGEKMRDAVLLAGETWGKGDGVLMMDYSSQEPGARKGKHRESVDLKHFRKFYREIEGIELDLMLEIKDKEASAARVLGVVENN